MITVFQGHYIFLLLFLNISPAATEFTSQLQTWSLRCVSLSESNGFSNIYIHTDTWEYKVETLLQV